MKKEGLTMRTNRPSALMYRRTFERIIDLIFEGELNQKEIAEKVGCGKNSISKWKTHPIWIEVWERKEAEYYSNK